MTIRKRLSNFVLISLLLTPVVVVGCQNSNAESDHSQTLAEKMGKPQVKTTQVVLRDFETVIEANGVLVPSRHTKLTALVAGKMERIQTDIGCRVRKGDLLFQIRTIDYELALQQAEASLVRAEIMVKDRKREMQRIENLFHGGSATEQMRDQAITALEESRAALEQVVAARDRANQSLADCTLRAPYDGVITTKKLEEGEFAAPGMEVLELMDLSTLNAELNVAERYAGTIGPDADVKITPSSGNAAVAARITAVNPKIDLTRRTYLIKAAVDNSAGRLQAGQFCTARFTLPTFRQQTAIPSSALIRDQGKSTVWIIDHGKALQQDVVENGNQDGWVWITAGLHTGQNVVVQGAGVLMDHIEVDVVN